MPRKREGKLNLHGLSPEEIARRLLETRPSKEPAVTWQSGGQESGMDRDQEKHGKYLDERENV